MPAYCCENNDATTEGQFVKYYTVYEISDVVTNAPNSHEVNCASNPQPDVEADPGASPPPPSETVDPTEPVVPAEPVVPVVDPTCTPKNSVGKCG